MFIKVIIPVLYYNTDFIIATGPVDPTFYYFVKYELWLYAVALFSEHLMKRFHITRQGILFLLYIWSTRPFNLIVLHIFIEVLNGFQHVLVTSWRSGSWLTIPVTSDYQFLRKRPITNPTWFWISGERQIDIRLNVRDHLSQRNNASPEVRTSGPVYYKSNLLSYPGGRIDYAWL